MHAVIDIGSNTIRMLLGDCHNNTIIPERYERQIVRLAGDLSPRIGLSPAAMERGLATLKNFRKIITAAQISQVRAVATAALRRASNRDVFIANVAAATGIQIEVIAGEEEARLTTLGVLSVIEPTPQAAIVIDIGGGSTELIGIVAGQIVLQKSYPIGAVNLCEEYPSTVSRQPPIDSVIAQFGQSLQQAGVAGLNYQLIGTAGTITTLAAIHLKLQQYNNNLINNHEISRDWLLGIQQKLESLSLPEREQLVGMETGRGDLILPGLQILLTLMDRLQFSSIKVSDYGLLEGVMLQLTEF